MRRKFTWLPYHIIIPIMVLPPDHDGLREVGGLAMSALPVTADGQPMKQHARWQELRLRDSGVEELQLAAIQTRRPFRHEIGGLAARERVGAKGRQQTLPVKQVLLQQMRATQRFTGGIGALWREGKNLNLESGATPT
jgi:hypothetical protein